ncbi:type I-U CRISPR-associated protein Csb2 [Candidatus Poriferisocius sp.]|uniref:type I-G CRISPR-associated protein Csb2 n=1 Tax=Candidatus Poriferisocius sp. TaxID=3101276 RepID=UPI003B0118DD
MHGHVNDGESDYQLARFLALPNVGHRYSDGKIHGATVWVPRGVDESEVRNLASTLSSIGSLSLAGGSRITVDRSRGNWTTDPRRWQGPARRWVTALPAVSDRHQRIDSAAVIRWCEQAGLPKPVQFRISRKPLLPGSVDLHPAETRRPGHTQTRPYAHVGLVFESPVTGPVVIGSARSYGLGLCAPCDPREDQE